MRNEPLTEIDGQSAETTVPPRLLPESRASHESPPAFTRNKKRESIVRSDSTGIRQVDLD